MLYQSFQIEKGLVGDCYTLLHGPTLSLLHVPWIFGRTYSHISDTAPS